MSQSEQLIYQSNFYSVCVRLEQLEIGVDAQQGQLFTKIISKFENVLDEALPVLAAGRDKMILDVAADLFVPFLLVRAF